MQGAGPGAGGWRLAAGPGLKGLSAGPKEADGMAEWLRRRVGPSAMRLADTEGAQALIDSRDVVVIGFFRVSCCPWGPGRGSGARSTH